MRRSCGFIAGQPSRTYGSGAALAVDLFVNGDARYTGLGNVLVTLPSPDTNTVALVRFERQSVYLNSLGAFANLRVWLPTGFGYRFTDTASRRLFGTIDFADVPLTQLLEPVSDLSVSPPIPGESLFACEETKPSWIEAMSLTWRIGTGVFEIGATGNLKYVRADELSQLETAPNNISAAWPHWTWRSCRRSCRTSTATRC